MRINLPGPTSDVKFWYDDIAIYHTSNIANVEFSVSCLTCHHYFPVRLQVPIRTEINETIACSSCGQKFTLEGFIE